MATLGKAFAALTVIFAPVVLVSSPASAADYPACADAQVQILSGSSTLVGGSTMKIKASATSAGIGLPGLITLSAEPGFQKRPTPSGFDTLTSAKHTASGTVTFKIKTSVVKTRKTFRVSASFVPDEACTASSGYRTAASDASITLVPRGSDVTGSNPSGILPSTGGVNSIYLILGGLFLVGGAATLAVGRKRAKHVV